MSEEEKRLMEELFGRAPGPRPPVPEPVPVPGPAPKPPVPVPGPAREIARRPRRVEIDLESFRAEIEERFRRLEADTNERVISKIKEIISNYKSERARFFLYLARRKDGSLSPAGNSALKDILRWCFAYENGRVNPKIRVTSRGRESVPVTTVLEAIMTEIDVLAKSLKPNGCREAEPHDENNTAEDDSDSD